LNLFAFEEEEDRRENRVLAEDEANRKDFLAQFVAISCSRSDWYNEGRSHRSFALWAAGSNQWIFQPTTTNGLGFLYLKKKEFLFFIPHTREYAVETLLMIDIGL
jgi:hypothetical protein